MSIPEGKDDQKKNGVQKKAGCLTIIIILVVILIFISIYLPSYLSYRENKIATDAGEKAYTASQAFIADHPKEEVILSMLQKYGLKVDPRVDLTVLDGNKDSLKLRSKCKTGSIILMIDYK